MNQENELSKIETFLRQALGFTDIHVFNSPEKKRDEYKYAIMLSTEKRNLFINGQDAEDYIIWKQDIQYGFSYNKHIPAKYKDQGGEPAIDEMFDCDVCFYSVLECLKGIVAHISKQNTYMAETNYLTTI